MAELSAKMAKIEEASRKKDELNNEFITQTKEALETKMEQYEGKREAIISDLKEKLKVSWIVNKDTTFMSFFNYFSFHIS